MIVLDAQFVIGRDHVDMIGLDRHAVLDLAHPHGGHALQQFRQHAFMQRVMCCTTTKAKPLSGGTLTRNSQIGSSPPAEAPMPTMGSSGAAAEGALFWSSWHIINLAR
jgi:hypothetical protein